VLQRFQRRPAGSESPEVAARWNELRQSEPELAAGIDLHRSIQRLQREAGIVTAPPAYTAEAAKERLAAGVPLLEGSGPFVELREIEGLFRRLCRSAVQGEAQSQARAVLAAIEGGSFDLGAALRAVCALDAQALDTMLVPLGEPAVLAQTLLRAALAPAFRAAALAYAPLLETSPWTRSVCPVCGSPPLLGELRGGESRRVLRCGCCGAAWEFQRLRCVYCDNRDHRRLSALHLEGQGDFLRIEVCDICSGYIKSMARLEPIPYELLPAEDLATAYLDLLALERGYGRPAPLSQGAVPPC
jgi:FdhE protein